MGILLAYSLLTVLFHAHNTIHGRKVSKPINVTGIHGCPANTPKPVGILPKVRQDQKNSESNHWEIDLSENTLDMEQIVPIFMKSMQKHSVMNASNGFIKPEEGYLRIC